MPGRSWTGKKPAEPAWAGPAGTSKPADPATGRQAKRAAAGGAAGTTPIHLLQPAAQRRWARTDPVLARLSREQPLEPWPLARDDPFEALVQAFCHQQVSMAAGAAIARRLEARLGGPATPARVLDCGLDGLREAGLSRMKALYVTDLAERVAAGEVPFAQFGGWSDDDVVEALLQVKGIGAWTAKMFLLFHLQRPDVFVPEDLGLRLAVAQFYGVPADESGRRMEALRPLWSPYNSVAARVLWQARRAAMAAGPRA